MSVGSFVLVATSIVDTVPQLALTTKAVVRSGVIATPDGVAPMPRGMSLGSLVRVATSMVDTELPPAFVTKAVISHPAAGACCAPTGATPTAAPAAVHTKAASPAAGRIMRIAGQ